MILYLQPKLTTVYYTVWWFSKEFKNVYYHIKLGNAQVYIFNLKCNNLKYNVYAICYWSTN
jgi:hypothetical protein